MRVATSALHWAARGVGALRFSDLGVWGRALGWVVGSALGVRRSHVVASMRAAGIPEPEAAASAMYDALGTSAIELLWLAARDRDLAAIAHIDGPSTRAIDEAKRGGRGLVFAASHTGNWDLAACAIASHVPLMVITKHLSMRGIDAFWQGTRARYGITLVGAAGALARARAHLAAGGAVAMMIDQVPDAAHHSVRAPFLGGEAHVDRAPFALAAACRVPLLVAAARRTEHGQALRVLTALTPPAAAATRWAHGAALEATAALDAFVRAHPSEWLWMHRRWRRPSDSRAVRRPERP